MSAAAIGLVMTVVALLCFAFIGVIIINHSLKQEEKRKAAFFQKFWGDK
ncbi:hypothetical protein L0337_20520 [candidate division KSB1 bacterium]|nr:hypothetical protein [candidate division KSB1 bacterium]